MILNLLLPVSSKVYFLEADFYQDKTQDRKIILGKGEVILSDKPISRVAVSDPSVVDIQILNEKQLFSRAKQLGTCTVLVWEKDKSTPSRFDVSVWPDIDFLTKQLQTLDKSIIVEYIPPSSNLSSGSSSQGALGAVTDPNAGGGTASPSPTGGQSSSSSSNSQSTTGRIILKGEVENAEIIARALQVAGAYVGDQGIKIISQPGGQIVDGLSGRYDIYSNSDSQSGQSSQGSATAFGARDPLRFTSNRYANLSRGVISTTQRGSVISFLTVKDAAQISVAIRFYEISRSAARNIGLNAIVGGNTIQGGSFVGGNGISQTIGGIGSIVGLMSFMSGSAQSGPEFAFAPGAAQGSFLSQAIGQGVTGVIFNPDNGIGAIIQALQERGEVKTLAEPNLVIANGEPASFLAGGEVPILRSVFTAGGASQDVTYEPFGIKFSILPTLTSKDKVFLQLTPEIRDIDTDLSNLVVPPGSTSVRPPAFRTRRTQTQVELYSGQAFAISGLLREDNTRNLRKVPGIGDTPVLGTLFRSKSFRKGQTELLIVVSPVIVKPVDPNKIAQFTSPEIPYDEFNQLPLHKPHFDMMDEQGPDGKEPIDAGKYNRAVPLDESNKSLNEEKLKKEKGAQITINDEIKKEDLSQNKQEESLIQKEEVKIEEPKKEASENIDPPVPGKIKNETSENIELPKPEETKKEISENVELQKPVEVKRSKWFDFKKDKSELPLIKERGIKEARKKLAIEAKQAKAAKKIEAEKIAREKEQVELKKREEYLKQSWQMEMQKYTQAKEAMKLARERKSN